jgi:hypothetical protein
MAIITKKVERFDAESDAGDTFEVIGLQHFTQFDAYQGRQLLPGTKFYRLSDGTELFDVPGDDDAFELPNGLRIRRIRP